MNTQTHPPVVADKTENTDKTNQTERILLVDNSSGTGECTARILRILNRCGTVDIVRTEEEARRALTTHTYDRAVLSGSPQTFSKRTVSSDTLRMNALVLRQAMPVLGVCFGMHAMAVLGGGSVRACGTCRGWHRVSSGGRCWFAHTDVVTRLPRRYRALQWRDGIVVAMSSDNGMRVAVQYHPEASRHWDGDVESLTRSWTPGPTRRRWAWVPWGR